MLVDGVSEAHSDEQKADLLNHFFSTCWNTPLSDRDNVECDISLDLSSILCSEEQILMELRNLNCAKATGPDGISARMLKETANTVCQPIKNLFNLLITQLSFPTSWKFAHVVPIPKGSSGKASPSNYRPISLLYTHYQQHF